jgi:hypothetical protein
MKREEIYSVAYIALFGGLWGVIEILLGNLLHAFEVPFKGLLLSAIGCFICLTASMQLPSRKNLPILAIGAVAIVVRLFSFGVFKAHILISMLTEVLLLQGAVLICGYTLFGFILGGVLACFAPYISGVLFFGVILGQSGAVFLHDFAKESASLRVLLHFGKAIIAVILCTHVLFGAAVGAVAYFFSKQLKLTPHA